MQNQSPLNKVVFIQKVAAFTKTKSLKDLFQLAYVNNSWNDTIKNYSFHVVEQQVRDVKSVTALETICVSVIKSGVVWFTDVLLSNKSVFDRINLLILVCKNVASLDTTRFVFKKIVEVGGKQLLKSQLSAADDKGWTCLMVGCKHSSSPEVMQLVCEKIDEVGGTAMLKSHLSATDDDNQIFSATNNDGLTCLKVCCWHSSSSEVVKLICEKIVEVGGQDFLKSQLAATSGGGGWSCLMFCCDNPYASPEVVKLVSEKIIEVGGQGLLQIQLAATDGWGRNCLTICSDSGSVSPKVIDYIGTLLFRFDLYKQQYDNLADDDKERLRKKAGIDSSSWTPDPESLTEVNRFCEIARPA